MSAAVVPVYLPEQLFFRLRDRADREGTSVNFLVIRILKDTLGPPEPPTPDRVMVR